MCADLAMTMSEQKLGNGEAAREALNRARNKFLNVESILSKTLGRQDKALLNLAAQSAASWPMWMIAKELLREAEALIDE